MPGGHFSQLTLELTPGAVDGLADCVGATGCDRNSKEREVRRHWGIDSVVDTERGSLGVDLERILHELVHLEDLCLRIRPVFPERGFESFDGPRDPTQRPTVS